MIDNHVEAPIPMSFLGNIHNALQPYFQCISNTLQFVDHNCQCPLNQYCRCIHMEHMCHLKTLGLRNIHQHRFHTYCHHSLVRNLCRQSRLQQLRLHRPKLIDSRHNLMSASSQLSDRHMACNCPILHPKKDFRNDLEFHSIAITVYL